MEPLRSGPDPEVAGGEERLLRVAEATALGARVASRIGSAALVGEIGVAAADGLKRERAQVAVQELRLDTALGGFAEVATNLGVPWVALKGAALRLAGHAPEAGRPASDLDLLVPQADVEALGARLLSAGFRASGSPGYEHQAPLLLHESGGAVEVHRSIPGLRLDGRRSATFDALLAERCLDSMPGGGFLPVREVLVAHALLHTLAQHAFVSTHPALLMIGDLLDLDAPGAATDLLARIEPWIGRDVAKSEAEAAFSLAVSLGAGEDPERLDPDPLRLLAHLVALATDARYGESLKLRWLERPVSDRPRWLARLGTGWRALVPERRRAVASETLSHYLQRLAKRPAELVRSWWRAREASRRG